jgi:hypothetical protein
MYGREPTIITIEIMVNFLNQVLVLTLFIRKRNLKEALEKKRLVIYLLDTL